MALDKEEKKAQSIVVYVLLLSVALAAIVGMQVYFKRGIQAKIKDLSDALIAPQSEHIEEVNATIPLLGDVDLGGGKYAAKKSVSESHLEEIRQENSNTITFIKRVPSGEEYSSVSNSKYMVTDDPSRRIKASTLSTSAQYYTSSIGAHKITGFVEE